MQVLSHMLWIMWTALTVYSLLANFEIFSNIDSKSLACTRAHPFVHIILDTRNSNTIHSVEGDFTSLGLVAANVPWDTTVNHGFPFRMFNIIST